MRSNNSGYAVLGIAGDGDNGVIGSNTSSAAYNFRSAFAGGQFINNALTAVNNGSGILAINSVYNQAIDLGHIGDGTWFLGSTGNGVGLTSGTYVGATPLTAGASYNGTGNSNATYRLGAGGTSATLNIGIYPGDSQSFANQLTGNTNLVIGSGLTNGTGGNLLRGTGFVVLNTAQNYTGSTVINSGSRLEFRGQLATSGFDVFGTNNTGVPSLIAGGVGGRFLQADGTTAIPVNFHPGGVLQLDNSFDLLANDANHAQGRWGDTAAVNLNGSSFKVVGSILTDINESVGQVTTFGQSFLTPSQTTAPGVNLRTTTITVAGITQGVNRNGNTGDNGSISIEPTTAGQLGLLERVMVSGAAPTVTNGIVAPWMWNQRESSFLTYNATTGFNNAAFTITNTSSSTTAPIVTAGTDIYWNKPGVAINLAVGQQFDVYALRTDNSINPVTASDATAKIIMESGGLLTGANSMNLFTGLVFGTVASPREADIHVTANTTTIGDGVNNPTTSGQITATNIVKDGGGTLQLDAEQGTFTGAIAFNNGVLTLNNRTSGNSGASNAGGNGGTIYINGYNLTLNLNAGSTAAGGSFNNNIYLAAGNPLSIIAVNRLGAASGQTMIGGNGGTGGNLTFGGSSGDQGQTLTINQSNGQTFRVNGTTNLGPSGNAIFVTNTDTFLAGLVTGAGTLVKEGGSNLYLAATTNATAATAAATQTNTFTGGITILGGGVVAPGVGTPGGSITTNPLGVNTTVTLVGGTLFLRADADNTTTFNTVAYDTNNIVVNGNSTITVDRTGAQTAETSKLVLVNNLTIGNETLTVGQGNSYRFGINGGNLTNMATLNLGADMVINGNLTDNGAGIGLIKTGGNTLWFANGNNSTFSGPLVINQGALRFGNSAVASATATVGAASKIIINPGASVQLEGVGNVNTGAGQQIEVRSAGSFAGIVQLNSSFDPSAMITSNSTGLLLTPASFTTKLNLSTIGDGTFQFATTGAFSYTFASMGAGAANPLNAGVGVYRLGGNNQNLTITATNNNVLTGQNEVQVGSLLSGGGNFLFNNSNDYTGGTVISRGTAATITQGGANTPMGTGQVDVFGTLTAAGTTGSFLNGAGTANNNVIVLHPGSYLQFDGNQAGNGGTTGGNANRWDDNTPIALNGSSLLNQSQSGQVQNETVGAISFANGSRISIINPGVPTGPHVLTTSSLTRVGKGTLVFTPGDTFGTNGGNTDNFSVTGGLPANVNGMMPAWYVDSFHNSFVKSASVSGLNLVQVVTPTQTSLGAGLVAGTDIVNLTAASTLVDNPVIYALMTNNNISNGPGQFNTITLSGTGASGSNVGGLLVYTNSVTIQSNIKAGTGGQFELPIYNSSALALNGDISAAGVTKFGTGVLTIGKDQSDAARGVGNGFNSGWVVNEGQLTLGAFGSLGNVGTAANPNLVLLNGSQSGAAQLNLTLNQGNTSNATYTSGRIVVLDNAVINYDPQANDRTQTINDVQVQSTGGTLMDAQLKFTFTNSRARSILETGVLSLTDASGFSNGGTQLTVTWGSNVTNGTSAGVSVASLAGSDRLTKWGAGVLYIRGDSTVGSTAADGTVYGAYTGNVSIEEGAIQILNPKALGNGTVTVKRDGVLDINTVGYTGAPTYSAGSIERWSADGARTGGITVDLTGGATLQIANDQTTGTATIKMNGGSIEGFLNTDSNITAISQGAVYRTIGAGYSFQLMGNSFLGQSITGWYQWLG
ncbi:autotransporter-associated beta strand repeat protein [Chthoniobacter flavus Ellin428]|uniref:Autotransporter-associated beta strand repeat protein n=1 Tax=Chthoniobacter flavus Ellin428 TaxID=497964 RepID=B4CYP2_9BACT|nr:autotransporter-associated beta strand repeat protein [Chthoniobacter flavus Ellin428]